ncbi:MAG: ferritin family protein [Bacteroidales bacterium]|nr:ferritin family protein [Bacteroidales bacterium]
MKTFNSIDEILDFAINSEQNAYNFYIKLATNSENDAMKDVFLEFAEDEKSHKKRLEKIKEDRNFEIEDVKVQDLKIAEYTVNVSPSDDMSYQEALLLAMKREKNAYKLYTDLAAIAPDEKMQRLFKGLANEEAKHKLRFELEYDDEVLREN